jgi:cell division cycle 20-like protein 1 (cofactor of APC complex)
MDGAGSSGAPPYAGLPPLPLASAVSSGASAGQRTPGGSPFPSPRGGRTAYSDRFIPSRALSSRLDASPLEREAAAAEAPRRGADREDGNGAYNLLLRSELLGFGAGAASPEKAAPAAGGAAPPPGSPHRSPGRSIFRYATGGAGAPAAGAPLGSPFSRGLVGGDGAAAAAAGPARLPRRIPRAPFKVLDAPALADDFYLNLVDWSSQVGG